jgi:hypothetical protein
MVATMAGRLTQHNSASNWATPSQSTRAVLRFSRSLPGPRRAEPSHGVFTEVLRQADSAPELHRSDAVSIATAPDAQGADEHN